MSGISRKPMTILTLAALGLSAMTLSAKQTPAPRKNLRGPVLIVTAHPDDETMFGATLGYLKENNIEVYMVTVTRGEGGHTNLIDGDITKLSELRPKELAKAAELYGVKKLLQLTEPDAAFRDPKTDVPTQDVDFFLKQGAWNVRQVKESVAKLAQEIQPDIIITLLPKHPAVHAHHQAAARITMELHREGRLGKRVQGIYGSYEIHWYPVGTFETRKDQLNFPTMARSEKLGMTYAEFQLQGAKAHATQTVSTTGILKEDEVLVPLFEKRPGKSWLRNLAKKPASSPAPIN